MRPLHRLSAFMLVAFLALGCGKKPGSDAPPAPEPTTPPSKPTPAGAQEPAGAPSIEGTYLAIGGEVCGEKMTAEEVAKEPELDRTVKINKDQIQFKLFSRASTRYKLDPSKVPAEIDLFVEEPGKKTRVSYGIYKIEGDTLTLFVLGADEPQFRPREFKTLDILKDSKIDLMANKRVGGLVIMTLKKVSADTTFISEPPPPKPKPKPPVIDEDEPVVAELTKKGFTAKKMPYGKFPGIDVTVPSDMPPDAIKELNGHLRIRSVTFKTTRPLDRSHPVTDKALQALDKLDGLTTLEFESCHKITAAAFRNLSRFPMLTTVSTSDTPTGDAAAEEIAKLKTLEWVALRGSKLTDKSLAALAKVRTLKHLWLSDTDVTAAGIEKLNALPDLELLGLQGTPGADAALEKLNLPKLKSLNFAQSNITEKGLSKLPVLPSLEGITLTGPTVTDAGLKHLLKQPKLRSISLHETKVTKAGAEELKKAKPKLYVSEVN